MTKKEYHRRHIKLWDWLYHYPSKGKSECPYWEWNGGNWEYVIGYCFACEECNRICDNCMFDWDGFNCINRIVDKDGYFYKWHFAKSPKTRKKYAKIIRDLKLKERRGKGNE